MIRFISIFILCSTQLLAQNPDQQIFISNGSFEGTPSCCKPPESWRNCGNVQESPTDIQPAVDGEQPLFGVTKKAMNGNTYLGMVVRDNETNERIGQRLVTPMLANQCYTFSIYLCKSSSYLSARNNYSQDLIEYTTPVILRIWGGEAYCNQKELLAETKPIDNTEWQKFEMELSPKNTLPYIEIEAYYKTPVLFPYNGNVLVDNMSHISVMPCPNTPEYTKYKTQKLSQEKLEKIKEQKIAEAKAKALLPPPQIKNGSAVSASSEKILKDLQIKNIKVGQTIKIEKLFFSADSTNFNSESLPALDEIFDFLYKNKKVKVEIGGHTNNIPSNNYCDILSTARAKSVRDYLLKKGIEAERINYKGYGKRLPLFGNATPEGRKFNQRVEIKILSIEG